MHVAARRRLLLDRSLRLNRLFYWGLPIVLAALLAWVPLSAQAQEVPSSDTISQQDLLTDERYNVQIRPLPPIPGVFFPRKTFKKVPDHFIPSGIAFPPRVGPSSINWLLQDSLPDTEVEGDTLSLNRSLSPTPYAFLVSGLYNQGNLVMAMCGNARILLDKNSEGRPGDFAIFGGEATAPLLQITENAGGTAQMVVNRIVASNVGGFRFPDGTVVDEQSDLQLNQPFVGGVSGSELGIL